MVLSPKQPQASRVQAPVDVFLNDFTLSLRSLDFRPTDVLNGFLTVEFSIEVLYKYEVLPQVFDPAFESPLEDLGFGKAASLSDFSNPIGNFSGYGV